MLVPGAAQPAHYINYMEGTTSKMYLNPEDDDAGFFCSLPNPMAHIAEAEGHRGGRPAFLRFAALLLEGLRQQVKVSIIEQVGISGAKGHFNAWVKTPPTRTPVDPYATADDLLKAAVSHPSISGCKPSRAVFLQTK